MNTPVQKLARANDLARQQSTRLTRSGMDEKEFLKDPVESKTLKKIQTIRAYANLELHNDL